MNNWVASDHHFSHRKILEFQPEERPFSCVEEMNEAIVERHNSLVKPNDNVYFLGDFIWGNSKQAIEFLRRMNGNKHFIFGNHDKAMRSQSVANGCVWMKDYHEIKGITKAPIVLFHFPIYSWNRMHYGAPHFYGHTHGAIPELFSGRARDVGLDTNDCYPYNIEDLVTEMEKVPVQDARDREVRKEETKQYKEPNLFKRLFLREY